VTPAGDLVLQVEPVPVEWCSDLPVFASEPFLRAVGDEAGWLGGLDDAGRVRCVLPYTIVHASRLRIVRFRTETILLDDVSLDAEQAFLDRSLSWFRSAGAHLVMPASTNTIFRTAPRCALTAPYGSYVIDLTGPEEAIWADVSSSHRRKVRQARAAGVEIVEAGDPGEVHELVRSTFARSRLPFMGPEAFERMVRALGDNVRILCAVHDGAVQGCAVLPFSVHAAYYVYGGSIPEPTTGAMHLLHWEAIAGFRAAGVLRYDFVGARIDPEPGSKQEGIATFKARFGGALRRGLIWKAPLRRLPFALYGLAARVRSGGDIVDQERRRRR
jgi:hypothetical protein